MKADLFKAILAMDAYNRGYDAFIDLRPRDGQGNFVPDPENSNQPTASDKNGIQIGTATILDNSSDVIGVGVDSAIGFYGLVYDIKNADGNVTDTIISYRGTDRMGQDAAKLATMLFTAMQVQTR